MKVAFVAVTVIKHPVTGAEVPFISPPWYAGHPLHGTDQWAGNIFCEDQASLDAALSDPRVAWAVPLEVDGKDVRWGPEDELPKNLHGKITSWIAKNKLHKLGNRKSPGKIAKHIMAQLSGVTNVDPLFFRIHW